LSEQLQHPLWKFYGRNQPFFQVEQLPTELAAMITYQSLNAGESLLQQGEFCNSIFALISGQIKLQYLTEAGQQINYCKIYPGEYFAEATLFDEIFTWTAVAVKNSRVAVLPKSHFLRMLQQDINLSTMFIQQLCYHLHQTTVLLKLRSMNSAQERVLSYLNFVSTPAISTSALAASTEKSVYLDCPLKEIASDLGLTPEALSRTLSKLQDEGVIRRSRKKIIILR
jgi:CRP/FNR family transcriptional regulator, dissimilatory nitrate respiration regulator